MALDERDFFHNKNETRSDQLTCPRCKRVNAYQMRWVVRTKKERLPPGADERDRAKFAKLRDHLLRLDDEVTCKTCGKKFEIPSLHSLQFVDQIEGLPKDVEELDDEPAAPAAPSPAAPGAPPANEESAPGEKKPLPARFTRPTKGWRG